MQKKKYAFAVVLSTILFCQSMSVSAASNTLKHGMRGESVTQLQQDLKKLGFFSEDPTGYYGEITTGSVKRLQAKYGLETDGIAGEQTFALVNKLMRGTSSVQTLNSRGGVDKREQDNYLMLWFGGVDKFFEKGDIATVYDIETGLSFKAKRTYGYNHADCEPATADDTAIMKKIYNGQWSWSRRAVIVTVNGRKIAASMAGMPHAGVESARADTYVGSRSGGYGRGANLDAVKGNMMSGHFDIHFLGSKTHGSNRVDTAHQLKVKEAAEWAKKNLRND